MITFKLFFIVLLFTNCVLCRDTRRGNTRHKQRDEDYKFNHPPEPESYETIPVAVLYEEDTNRNDKSIKSEIATKNNVEEVTKDSFKTEANITKELDAVEEVNNGQVDSKPIKVESENQNLNNKKQDKPAATTLPTNSKQDLQIPVAVVYELEASYYNEPRPTSQRVSSKRRKVQRPVIVEKKIEVDEQTETNVQEYKNAHTRVTDTSERLLSNSENSRPVQSFAKRDNSTRQREVIPIIQSENLVFSHSGDFQYSYEGGDGTKAFEKGELKTFDDDNAGEAVSGGFSYTAKDGNEYSLTYTADENGYRPVGAHLPTPPPIPPAIARALAYLATKTTPEPVTESLYEATYS